MSGAADEHLVFPDDLPDRVLDFADAADLVESWGHPKSRRWLTRVAEEGRISLADLRAAGIWRELLKDECDKLYNQAWCALEQIQDAENEEDALFLAIDDLPSAVEQAFSLAPVFAGEHFALLEKHKPERHRDLCRELGVGTDREDRERIDCLQFWEENGESLSDLRRTLFRLVREGLERRVRED